jgi:hypothetical protein
MQPDRIDLSEPVIAHGTRIVQWKRPEGYSRRRGAAWLGTMHRTGAASRTVTRARRRTSGCPPLQQSR